MDPTAFTKPYSGKIQLRSERRMQASLSPAAGHTPTTGTSQDGVVIGLNHYRPAIDQSEAVKLVYMVFFTFFSGELLKRTHLFPGPWIEQFIKPLSGGQVTPFSMLGYSLLAAHGLSDSLSAFEFIQRRLLVHHVPPQIFPTFNGKNFLSLDFKICKPNFSVNDNPSFRNK
jgi:hypothetical protein